jgi:SAM-dependent methyltransferase
MDGDTDRERALVTSWSMNAAPWSDAVRSNAIASRRLTTDRAVVQAVLSHQPASVLDLGCGEGWLSRRLAESVGHVVGIDISPELIARANEAGGATFHQIGFDALIREPTRIGQGFDVIVANFALLGAGLPPLLAALRTIGGALIVQTLHPSQVEPPYEDGWREERFFGFGADGSWSPMPWYFRTTATWLTEIARHWTITQVEEPLHPETRKPASLLVSAKAGTR